MPLVSEAEAPAPRPVRSTHAGEPAARRLGVLYVGSLTVVAVLTGLSLEFALREMAWQVATLRAVCQTGPGAGAGRGLVAPALTLVTAVTPAERTRALDALHRARGRWEKESPLAVLHPVAGKAGRGAEAERAQAAFATLLRSAGELAGAYGPDGRARATPESVRERAQAVVEADAAFQAAAGDAVAVVEAAAARRVDWLRSLEVKLFAFVMGVLLLEGLFVISPAVRKLQEIIAEMDRSHRELTDYAGRLERSNRELQDFASVASHDLQEPLRKVQAFSDRLRTRCAASLDAQGRDYLDRVQNATLRMQTLIDDLLTYSRISTKALPFEPVDLAAATRDVLGDLEVRIERTGGRVEVAELPTIEADPVQVRQLMQNLIGNALKYHRPDVPPVVRVYCEPPGADPAAPSVAGACRLLVEDNGIGFDPAYSERIFGIFQRLHGRNEYEGTGVGLAVCRKIVERHGGTVAARSTPGVGSVFTVTLPVRQPREVPHDGRAA